MSKWQPIETSPCLECILVWRDGHAPLTAYRERGEWLTAGGRRISTPTHWMPLPEPPEEPRP